MSPTIYNKMRGWRRLTGVLVYAGAKKKASDKGQLNFASL